jgi:alkanesulfonate monooxygenase SsuD/methylene tetrahydromethanopterin reductase-like flavin-dependent oxidoreductase (luciferase family)
MKLGIILEKNNNPDVADEYDCLIEQARFAETEGFASVWVADHDFTLAASIAEVTEHIRVGVVSTPALLHPLKTAEDAAVLDLISNGRLLFGADPHISKENLENCSIASEQTWSRFIEAMDIIVRSWTHDGFAYLGEYNRIPLHTTAESLESGPFVAEPCDPPFIVPWQRAGMPVDYVSLQPKPQQIPRPPVFVRAADEKTARFAASMGYSLLLEARNNQQFVATCAQAYWHELARAGRHRHEVTLAITLNIEVHEDNEAPEEPGNSSGNKLSGSADQVLTSIKALIRDTGAFHLLCKIGGNRKTQNSEARSLHLLASEVRPGLEM